MDEPHRNLLNIWVFDKGEIYYVLEGKVEKTTVPRLQDAACKTL
jgi:hypothetical protein